MKFSLWSFLVKIFSSKYLLKIFFVILCQNLLFSRHWKQFSIRLFFHKHVGLVSTKMYVSSHRSRYSRDWFQVFFAMHNYLVRTPEGIGPENQSNSSRLSPFLDQCTHGYPTVRDRSRWSFVWMCRRLRQCPIWHHFHHLRPMMSELDLLKVMCRHYISFFRPSCRRYPKFIVT